MKLNGNYRVDFVRKSGDPDYDVFGSPDIAVDYARFLAKRGYTVNRVWDTQKKEDLEWKA